MRSQKLDGAYLQAFLSAHESFQSIKDLSAYKKRLVHYELVFTNDRDNYLIDFNPKLRDEDSFRRGGETSLGRALRFTVRKRDFKVIDMRRWR